jgi:small subunit ribosomal protein S6
LAEKPAPAKQSVYDCMVIFDSNKYAQDPGKVGGQITALVEKLGGEVLVSRLWNDQKLAYPIDGHKKGTYWLTYFKLDGKRLVEFNRELRINETVVRALTLKVEPRLVDALVEHAKGGLRPRAPEPTVGAPERIIEMPDLEEVGELN